MKKLIFLTLLSLLLGVSSFSSVHHAKATTFTTQATDEIWFDFRYSYNGQWVMSGTLLVWNDTSYHLYHFTAGGAIIQANIGDHYSVSSLDQSAGASGIITSTYMAVLIN
ncbi:hypothetical protein ACTJJB_20215 [Chitinophaga sp. 22536]|uniref:hypothetical protein n=1 Tax=unclassified Chitinophaga TaxID=2619133 RepID=UPI003F85534C